MLLLLTLFSLLFDKFLTAFIKSFGTGSQILREIGIKKMRVVSEPKQMQAISGFDLEILEYIDKEGI